MTLTPASSAARTSEVLKTSEVSTLEPFADRIDRLFGELELAVKFDRPSILLAVYSSEFIRADAEAALTAKLRDLGQTVAHYRVTGGADADIPLHLSERTDRATTVYFVSGLQWGGGRDGALAYRALNIRREYFVDYRIRAVFWLTEKEAAVLPRLATDFWVFRHQVVEFLEAPDRERMTPIAREAAWRGLDDHTLREDTTAKIALREALLQELPEEDETLAARADLLYTLAGLHWARQEYEKSVEFWQQALRHAKRLNDTRLETGCHNGLGTVYADLGRADDAIAAYRRAIELDPQFASPYNGLGTVYRDLGRADDAIAAFQRAIELDPQYAYPHNGLGNVYADLGRPDDAIAAFRRASELDPQLAAPHNGLGNVYADLGRTNDAIATFQRAIALDPQYAYPRNGLGNVYAGLSRPDDAIAEYQRALEIGGLPDGGAKVHNSLGNVYANLGRVDDAITAFRRAIALDPQLAAPHNGLGIVYRDLGRTDDAIAAFRRAIELDGLSDRQLATVHHNLGQIYQTLAQEELALDHYRQAIELAPQVGMYHSSLAGILRRLGRQPEFAAAVQTGRAVMATETVYNRACFEAICGNTDAALALLREAIEQNPSERAQARRDPDFTLIRDDPRFGALVGE